MNPLLLIFITLILGPAALLTIYYFYRLYYPNILAYPWLSQSQSFKRREISTDETTEVVLAGSYNPPHYGHLAMISYLARRYKKVHVVIGINPDKVYQVTPNQRADILEKMLDVELNQDCKAKIKVEIVADYIWRYAKSKGARILFRGIRTWERDGKDERALLKLNLLGPLYVGFTWPLQTYYLEGKPEYINISSTMIREVCSGDNMNECVKELESFAPKEIAKDLYLAYH